jgi:hypothetical protein
MSISARFVFLTLLFSVNAPLPALANVDQEFFPPGNAVINTLNVGASNRNDFAQTFTVGRTGVLTGFDISAGRQVGVTMPLLYDIRKTATLIPEASDSLPGVLAFGSVPASAIAPSDGASGTQLLQLLHIDLAQPIPVNINDVLAIVLRSDDPGSTQGRTYPVRASVVNSFSQYDYPGGILYYRYLGTWEVVGDGVQDLFFRTYVVPEPSTLLLAAVGLPLLLRRQAARNCSRSPFSCTKMTVGQVYRRQANALCYSINQPRSFW